MTDLTPDHADAVRRNDATMLHRANIGPQADDAA